MPLIGIILFVVFLVLKLNEVIDWSWVWVTSPLWIAAIFWLFIIMVIGNQVRKVHNSVNNHFNNFH